MAFTMGLRAKAPLPVSLPRGYQRMRPASRHIAFVSLAHILEAIGSPARFELLLALHRESEVGALARDRHLPLSTVSRHLHELESVGLAHGRRDGQKRLFRMGQNAKFEASLLGVTLTVVGSDGTVIPFQIRWDVAAQFGVEPPAVAPSLADKSPVVIPTPIALADRPRAVRLVVPRQPLVPLPAS